MIARNLTEIQDLALGDWTLKIRPPLGPGSERAILLNHGWTGDERVMWVFANQLPKNAWLIAPRAPYASTSEEHGGYSWVADRTDGFSSYEKFGPAKRAFLALLDQLAAELDINLNRFSLVGFSQGAAFNYSFALDFPQRVQSLAALAGFAPEGSAEPAQAHHPLAGLPVFIAHGARDETVPLVMAQESVALMQMAGADVEYCESDVGHKLGANCFSALKTFFATH